MMLEPQLLNHSADPIHTKLLEVDSELAAQAAELMAQLKAIQEKRQGLQTVMELFSPANPPAAETASQPEPVAEVVAASPVEPSPPISTTEAPAAPAPLPQVAKQTPPPARRRRAAQPAKTQTAKQSADWQPYIRAEFAQTSLAEVVAQMLQAQPDDVFGIPTMVKAIVVDEIPKAAWNKARNRISNILAAGARKNRWYRDQTGHYSLSPAAVGPSVS